MPAGRGRAGGHGRPLHPGRARVAVRARDLAPARVRPRGTRRARRHVRHPGPAAEILAGQEGTRRTRLMTPPAWLLVAAALLALAAGWCASAEAALALMSGTSAGERQDRQERPERPEAASRAELASRAEAGAPRTVAADLPRYL